MKNSIGDKQRIEHILDAIRHIENFTVGITYEDYLNNYQLRLALVKLLEIIGEAASMLSDDLRQEFSDIEWRTLRAVRNILVHEYFGISYDIIWESIQQDIQPLKHKIQYVLTKGFEL
jgi:uncharacterized protein with HEPN domain